MVETDFSKEWMERITTAEQLAEAGANRLQKQFPRWNIQVEASDGDPATTILEKAKTWLADLIVIGTHGRNALARVVLGSVSMKILKEAPCSVRVARLRQHDGPLRLLIGVDGSAEADAMADEVCRRIWPAGTQVGVLAVQEILVSVHAGRTGESETIHGQLNEDEYFRMKHVAKEAVEKLLLAGLKASPIVQEGDPIEALVQKARDRNVDAIFVGARGLGGSHGFMLGSVSASTVAHAPCTVEVVRSFRR
jgi:nucleotide-binding universal stress UspA family protein